MIAFNAMERFAFNVGLKIILLRSSAVSNKWEDVPLELGYMNQYKDSKRTDG